TALRMVGGIETGTCKHLHVVRFEDLTTRPAETMKKVYAYLGEPPFEHDFNNVEQTTREDDTQFNIYGDHRIRRRVEPVRPDYHDVLGRAVSDLARERNPVPYKTLYPEMGREAHAPSRPARTVAAPAPPAGPSHRSGGVP